jgi:hypothetical protein
MANFSRASIADTESLPLHPLHTLLSTSPPVHLSTSPPLQILPRPARCRGFETAVSVPCRRVPLARPGFTPSHDSMSSPQTDVVFPAFSSAAACIRSATPTLLRHLLVGVECSASGNSHLVIRMPSWRRSLPHKMAVRCARLLYPETVLERRPTVCG